MGWPSWAAGIIAGGTKLWNWYKGAKTATEGARSIFQTLKGIPGQLPVGSLVGQAPDLNFGQTRMGLMEGAGKRGYSGDISLGRPSGKAGNEWINMQAKYLQYLNMAEEFEEPGKVRRAIKLKV